MKLAIRFHQRPLNSNCPTQSDSVLI